MQISKMITLLAFAAVAVSAPGFAKPKAAKEVPSATASFTGESVAVGVGYTWGKGVLTFKGKTYPFKVDGLSAVGIGVTKITGTGTIYHLKSVTDFAGTYATAGGGGSVGSKGQSSASMRNDKGVVMEFKAREKGVSVNLDLGGVHITMMPK